METFNKTYRHLLSVANFLDDLMRPDGLLLESFVPIAIENFVTGEDIGFRKALRCENYIPESNVCGLEKFYEVREKIGNLIQLQAVPYPDLMAHLRDMAITATALFFVNPELYTDVPSFSSFSFYMHGQAQPFMLSGTLCSFTLIMV